MRPPEQARVVILHKHPEGYPPEHRCLTVGKPMSQEEAEAFALEAAKRLPTEIQGFAFLEGAWNPATTRTLTCPPCRGRSNPVDLRKTLGIR